jgi:hypothetical protein
LRRSFCQIANAPRKARRGSRWNSGLQPLLIGG